MACTPRSPRRRHRAQVPRRAGGRAPTTMRTRVFGTATAPTGSPDQANAAHADIPTVTVHRHRLLALVIVAACALAWVPAALAAPDPPTGLTAASPTNTRP